MYTEFIGALATLFIIMEPFASIPVFLGITRKSTDLEKANAANIAAFVAGSALVLFIVFGQPLLSILGVSVKSLEIGGGIILMIVAIQLTLGIALPKEEDEVNAAVVLIGVPLITGPGALTTSIVLVSTYGMPITLLAGITSTLLCWIILQKANSIYRILGKQAISIASRIMGLLLSGIAVEFIRAGLAA